MPYVNKILGLLFLSVGFAQGNSCLTCKFPMSAESSRAGQANPCEDLFGASCMATNGKPKYEGAAKKLSADLLKMIREARNKTVQAMGYKDIDHALKSKMKEAGIVLKEPPDQEAWKNLIGEGGGSFISENGNKLYALVEQCEKEAKKLQAIKHSSLTDITALNAIVSNYESFQRKYRAQSITLYAKDIPNFINNGISPKCRALSFSPSEFQPQDNPEIVKACNNIAQIKRRAVELYRTEGTGGYDKRAQQFVIENMPPELKYNYTSTTRRTPGTPPPKKTNDEKLRHKIDLMDIGASSICSSYSLNIVNAGKKVTQDLMKIVAKSKTTVDTLIDNVYSKEKEKLANEIYQSARSDIQDLTKSFVKDPKKRGEIIDGYYSLKLFWMKKPKESAYIKDKSGILVLDESKVIYNPADLTDSIFFDPNLSFFTNIDAFYTPSISYGKMKIDEQVNMMPAFASMLDKNPYAYLAVVAHEVGHKIDPKVGKVNGYDLTSEYRDLLACYKNHKSIKLLDNQADETMSDYFSAEVLARQIQKLPAEKRKQAVMSSMEGYCLFDDRSNQQHSFSCKGVHPENSLRVSGIFGANPSIRKILGCQKDSSKYKTCGLKVSILELNKSNTTMTPVGSKGGSKDTNSSKGLR